MLEAGRCASPVEWWSSLAATSGWSSGAGSARGVSTRSLVERTVVSRESIVAIVGMSIVIVDDAANVCCDVTTLGGPPLEATARSELVFSVVVADCGRDAADKGRSLALTADLGRVRSGVDWPT